MHSPTLPPPPTSRPCSSRPCASHPRRPPPAITLAAYACLLVLAAASTAVHAAPAPPSRDANKLPPCASSYALWNRDIPAEFDMGFLSVKSGFECAGHVVGGAYARVAVYKKSENRCYMKGVPKSSEGTLHGHRGEVLGTHRIPGHVVTSATFTNQAGSSQSPLGDVQDQEPPYNWAHVFDSAAADGGSANASGSGGGMAACDLVFRQGDTFECQRFKECKDCVMYVGWNCAADEEEDAPSAGEDSQDLKEPEGDETVGEDAGATGENVEAEDKDDKKE